MCALSSIGAALRSERKKRAQARPRANVTHARSTDLVRAFGAGLCAVKGLPGYRGGTPVSDSYSIKRKTPLDEFKAGSAETLELFKASLSLNI